MSGAASAAEALRAPVEDALRAVSAAVSQARGAQAALRVADDLVPTMAATADVILAMEALQAAGKAGEAAARQALAATMADTGATTVQTAGHTVSLKASPRTARIIDPAQIPPSLMLEPPPKPDMVQIGRLLRDGTDVPGATLNNQGPPTVQIRNRTAA